MCSQQAKVLMKGVDDITLGMGGAADTLILAAQSGDTGLLQEQAKSIETLASSLQTMARDAIEGWVLSTIITYCDICSSTCISARRLKVFLFLYSFIYLFIFFSLVKFKLLNPIKIRLNTDKFVSSVRPKLYVFCVYTCREWRKGKGGQGGRRLPSCQRGWWIAHLKWL